MKSLTDKICGFFTDCAAGVGEAFEGLVDCVSAELTNLILESSQVTAMTLTTMWIATTCVALMVCKQLFTTYILESDGDPDSDPLSFLVKASISLALIWTTSEILEFLINCADHLCTDLLGGRVGFKFDAQKIKGLDSIVAVALFCIIHVIFVILLSFKLLFRMAELCLMKILYPFFCVDIMTTSQERWKSFFCGYLVRIFGYIVSLICLKLGEGADLSTAGGFLLALVWLWFGVKAPDWLEKYVYSSGARRSAAGAGRAIMQLRQMRMMRNYYSGGK